MTKVKVFDLLYTVTSLDVLSKDILEKKYNKKMIVTPNVDHIVRFNKDLNFRNTYFNADVVVNDSKVVNLFSKLINMPIGYTIPGSDLTESIFNNIKNYVDINITVIGGDSNLMAKLCDKYALKNITHYNPPMNFHTKLKEMNKCLDLCKRTKADIIFLAVGSPKQELVAELLKKNGVDGCYLCIGASLLFLTGQEKRASKFIQKMHCEWLFRLVNNPRRLFKRYLVDGLSIFPIVYRQIKNK